jgi:hypothetical protein
MSKSRLNHIILLSSLASVVSLGLFSNKQQPSPAVTLKKTNRQDNQPSAITSYELLTKKLSQDSVPSAIFKVALNRQHQDLSSAQVFKLAYMALKNSRAVQLDLLAGYFPTIITPEWINQALMDAQSSSMFSSLVRKHAEGKIAHLLYLFDPKNSVVLIEQSDSKSLNQAVSNETDHKIVLVDTEPYAPSYKLHT